jgi:hypothetical protein
VWDELREKHVHIRIIDSSFEDNALIVKSLVAWEWIVSIS